VKPRKRRFKKADIPLYRLSDEARLREDAPANTIDNPYAVFFEWSSEADEKAYGRLCKWEPRKISD
jgi:hypothetical protein